MSYEIMHFIIELTLIRNRAETPLLCFLIILFTACMTLVVRKEIIPLCHDIH